MSNNKKADDDLINQSKQIETKESIKKDLAFKAEPKCSICGKFYFKAPSCSGHGGGTSDGAGSDQTDSKETAKETGLSNGSASTTSHASSIAITTQSDEPRSIIQMDSKRFVPEIISDLLAKNLLVIDNNKELGILNIKLNFAPKLLSVEQRLALNKYIDMVLKALSEFKKEHGITAKCYQREKDSAGNTMALRITLMTPKVYDAFILRLANQFLLPQPIIQQQGNKKVLYQPGINYFQATPFAIKPKGPSTNAKDEDLDEDDVKKQKPAFSKQQIKPSTIRPKSPRDGLKPKGFEK
jgi:hypothetical protein